MNSLAGHDPLDRIAYSIVPQSPRSTSGGSFLPFIEFSFILTCWQVNN
jgi:hypothetical protein